MENRNKETNERKKKKAPKYEHRGQVVFTYLYFSHARIRAARICLINTFPARVGEETTSKFLYVARISKNRFPSSSPLPSRAFFSRLHGIRNTSYKEGGTNRPYGPISIYQRHQPRGINSRIYRCRTTLEYERYIAVYVSRLSNTYNLFRLFRTLLRRGGWIR